MGGILLQYDVRQDIYFNQNNFLNCKALDFFCIDCVLLLPLYLLYYQEVCLICRSLRYQSMVRIKKMLCRNCVTLAFMNVNGTRHKADLKLANERTVN